MLHNSNELILNNPYFAIDRLLFQNTLHKDYLEMKPFDKIDFKILFIFSFLGQLNSKAATALERGAKVHLQPEVRREPQHFTALR